MEPVPLRRAFLACPVALFVLASVALAQDKEPPAVDQAKVDAAVEKGSEWLRGKLKAGLPKVDNGRVDGDTYNELVLYTLIHAGVDRGDPAIIKLVDDIRGKPPQHTYTCALRAMAFELYDPAKLRFDLAQCCDFLVNNQGKNGQWGYGRPIPVPPIPKVTFTPTHAAPNYHPILTEGSGGTPAPGIVDAGGGGSPAPAGDASAGGAGAPPAAGGDGAAGGTKGGDKPAGAGATPTGGGSGKTGVTEAKKPPPKLMVGRRDWGVPNDNSNTQYAMLGLSACMAEGVYPPPDALALTEDWMTKQQTDEGGWGYRVKSEKAYGSMTAGGMSSIAVADRGIKNRDPRKDPRIQKAVEWMSKNLEFDRNPRPGKDKADEEWQYYWIYGIERAGALAETEWFGDRPWYHDGAEWLIRHQNGDGTWGRDKGDERIRNTCWAILFLRRATRHIVQVQKRNAPIYTGGAK